MSEKILWQYIKKGMGSKWDATRHEDRASVGIPDVSFGLAGANGWLELKHLDRWPMEGALVGMRSAQTIFLMRRGRAGDRCWVLIKAEGDYYLVSWTWAKTLSSHRMNPTKLTSISSGTWRSKINWEEFAYILQKKEGFSK